MATMLVDELLPIFDISDELAVVVEATPERTWHALMNADLIDVARRRPLVGALGALRALPEIVAHVLHGESPPSSAQAPDPPGHDRAPDERWRLDPAR